MTSVSGCTSFFAFLDLGAGISTSSVISGMTSDLRFLSFFLDFFSTGSSVAAMALVSGSASA
jgi:hypothetical protein